MPPPTVQPNLSTAPRPDGGDRNAGRREPGQGHLGLQAAVGQAAGYIQKEARRHQHTATATEGSEPLELVAEGCPHACAGRDGGREASGNRTEDGRAALLASPLGVGLDAEHPVGGLPVVSKLTSEQAAVQVTAAARAGRDEHAVERIEEVQVAGRATPAIAAVDADVEAGPVPHRSHHRRRRRRLHSEDPLLTPQLPSPKLLPNPRSPAFVPSIGLKS